MAHPHEQRIRDFYTAFQRKDHRAMADCYHPDLVFSDPVFPHLDYRHASGMWRMFFETPGTDLSCEFRDVQADDRGGRAHWDARYTFSRTGRNVLNSVDASFEFRDGKIVRHRDQFDFWRWSRQALGAPGALLGWSPFLRRKVQAQGARNLEAFLTKVGA